LRFIDLYAGIGGFRLGFEREGHECVWSCEIDKYCRQVYRYWWEEPEGEDVREVDPESIPEFELLCAGFPCQSFSLAGERKGFEDTRGTLFHEICRILRVRRPPHCLLENVEGLLSTQEREAFRVVLQSLDECGYDAEWQVLNSKDFGVPQNRSRVFITGHLRGEPRPEVLPVAGGEETPQREDEESRKEREGVRSEVSSAVDAGYDNLRACGETYVAESILQDANILQQDSKCMLHDSFPDFRTYSEESPSISTPSGGRHLPFVVADRTRTYAGKGRNLESPKYHTNALTDVQKDNLVVQKLTDAGFQKDAYDSDGLSPTVREGHGDVVRILDDYNQRFTDGIAPAVRPTNAVDASRNASKVVRIAERFGSKQSGGVYSKDGISPTVNWGKRGPFPHHISELKLMPHSKTKLPFMGSAPKPKGKGEISFPLASSGAYKLAKRVGKSTREVEQDGDEDIYAGYVDIRKLTPVECERLQGFPDGWTEWGLTEDDEKVEISDTQRYKMLGNAVTVNVVEFLAERYRRFEEDKL